MAKQDHKGWASARDVERFAAQLPDAMLECREMGHQWRPFTASRLPGRQGFERVLKCRRCPAERLDYMSTHGERLSSHIKYPPEYLAKDMGRIAGEGRDIIRLESVHRTIEHRQPARAKLRAV